MHLGIQATDLDYKANNSLGLNSGTINDIAGNAATLTLASPGSSGSLGAKPRLLSLMEMYLPFSSVTSTVSDDTYKLNDVIPVVVTFSEAVIVTGTPQILETGSNDAVVDYSSGSGSTTS